MHSDVAHFDLHVEGNNVEAADFGAAAGDALDFSDHAPPHIALKGIGGGVPESGQQGDQAQRRR